MRERSSTKFRVTKLEAGANPSRPDQPARLPRAMTMPPVETTTRPRKATPMSPSTWRTSLGELCDTLAATLSAERPDDAKIAVAFEALITGYQQALGFVGSSISPTALAALAGAPPTSPRDVATKARGALALIREISKSNDAQRWPEDLAASARAKRNAGKLGSRV